MAEVTHLCVCPTRNGRYTMKVAFLNSVERSEKNADLYYTTAPLENLKDQLTKELERYASEYADEDGTYSRDEYDTFIQTHTAYYGFVLKN